jgi:hypothetical protein
LKTSQIRMVLKHRGKWIEYPHRYFLLDRGPAQRRESGNSETGKPPALIRRCGDLRYDPA